jgi:hypothetical protein
VPVAAPEPEVFLLLFLQKKKDILSFLKACAPEFVVAT